MFTNFDRYYRYRRFGKAPRYNGLLCADCTKRNKEIAYKADCEMCGGKDKVEVNIGYMAYLRSKRYHLPRYCPDCKKKREERKNSPSEESLSTAEFEEDWGREAWDD